MFRAVSDFVIKYMGYLAIILLAGLVIEATLFIQHSNNRLYRVELVLAEIWQRMNVPNTQPAEPTGYLLTQIPKNFPKRFDPSQLNECKTAAIEQQKKDPEHEYLCEGTYDSIGGSGVLSPPMPGGIPKDAPPSSPKANW